MLDRNMNLEVVVQTFRFSLVWFSAIGPATGAATEPVKFSRRVGCSHLNEFDGFLLGSEVGSVGRRNLILRIFAKLLKLHFKIHPPPPIYIFLLDFLSSKFFLLKYDLIDLRFM